MPSDASLSQWLDALRAHAATLQDTVGDPWFWTQFGIIAAVFVLARWLFAPVLRRGFDWGVEKSARSPGLRRAIRALRGMAIAIAWLVLQWFAIGVVDSLGWPRTALTVVASLLSAWLLIRVATLLVENRAVARAVAIVAWTVAALNIFGWLQPTMAILDSWSMQVGSLRLSPLTVVKGAFALWFALWLAGLLAAQVERQLGRSRDISPAMRALGVKLTRVLLIAAAILIALSAVGIDLTALAVFSGALGVGLGFGLQKIFSNLVSGVILLMDRSIKPGDVISVGQTFGWINHLGARYVSVITRDGIEHLIPNEELITQRVENWSFSDNLVRLRIPVGVSYNADPRLAQRLCVEAALAVPRVKAEPEPRCQLTGFGNSSVDLELRVWIDDPPQGRGSVINDVLLGIWDRFHAHGVEIPFPQQDLHLRSAFAMTDLGALKRAWREAGEDAPGGPASG